MLTANDKRTAMPDYTQYPDRRGHFGDYGGVFVAETLIAPLDELTAAYTTAARRSGIPG